MRVAIVHKSARAGRKLAQRISDVSPDADVLLYTDPAAACRGMVDHEPDVVIVASDIGPPGCASMREVAEEINAKIVGAVATPDPSASLEWLAAGATLVAGEPLDDYALRQALRHRAGGVAAG